MAFSRGRPWPQAVEGSPSVVTTYFTPISAASFTAWMISAVP